MSKRFPVKISVSRIKTGWIAWCAWFLIGVALIWQDFTDTKTSGYFALIATAPFWLLWLMWPIIVFKQLFISKNDLVDFDEDLPYKDRHIRVVSDQGRIFVAYSEFLGFDSQSVFNEQSVMLRDSSDQFVLLENLIIYAQEKGDTELLEWAEMVVKRIRDAG